MSLQSLLINLMHPYRIKVLVCVFKKKVQIQILLTPDFWVWGIFINFFIKAENENKLHLRCYFTQ